MYGLLAQEYEQFFLSCVHSEWLNNRDLLRWK
jgi:hypothetical protein